MVNIDTRNGYEKEKGKILKAIKKYFGDQNDI